MFAGAVKPVLIVTHLPDRRVGLVRDALQAAGGNVIERNPGDAGPLPGVDDISGIVTLGGRQSATRFAEDPFVSAEVNLLRSALAREVPVLGMCLGAQLLAVAAGGRVTNTGRMSAGWPALTLLPAAGNDLVFGGLPNELPVLKWHEDAISLGSGAQELGTTPGPGVALFRVGSRAWGSQAHLELTPGMLVDGWLTNPSDVAEIEGAGHEIDAFRADSRERLVGQMAAAEPMFQAFGRVAGGG